VMEHSGQKTLYELAKDGRLSYPLLAETVDLVCDIQMVGEKHRDELSIENVIDKEKYISGRGIIWPNKIEGKSIYFINKARDALNIISEHHRLGKQLIDDFGGSYGIVNSLLVEYPRELYKDSNLRNFLVGNYGEVVAIDFERLMLMPPHLELVKVLESGAREYVNEKERNGLIMRYILTMEHLKKERINQEQFFIVYDAAGIHNHVSVVGYLTDYSAVAQPQQRLEMGIETAQHFRRADEHVQRLDQTYEKDPKAKTEIRELGKVIREIERKVTK